MEDYTLVTFENRSDFRPSSKFVVTGIMGNQKNFYTNECLVNEYLPFENIMEAGIVNNYLRVAGGDDGHPFWTYQNIILPSSFTNSTNFYFYRDQSFDYPAVLSSITPDKFFERVDYGKHKANLTPLQEFMFENIIYLFGGYISDELKDDELTVEGILDKFEDGYDLFDYMDSRALGSIERIHSLINGMMFEAMYYLSDSFNSNYQYTYKDGCGKIKCV